MHKCTFSFRNDDVHMTEIADGINLLMQRIGSAVARVYFIDDTYAEVDIPVGISVHDNTTTVDVNAVGQSFYLGWTDKYTIRFGDVVVMDLLTQRQWAVCATSDREITTVRAQCFRATR